MDFGRSSSVDDIDFRLPEDAAGTTQLLARQELADLPPPRLLLGTPQWGEPGFVGKIYPPRTPRERYLHFYSRQFQTIELNSTFYGVQPSSVDRWRQQVPTDFLFCPKFPGRITHELRLKDCDGEVIEFLEEMLHFGPQLGPCWLLLPANLGADAAPQLQHVIDLARAELGSIPLAVEFRHRSWFRSPEIFNFLEDYATTAIITDVSGRRDVLHQRLTHTTAIIRFVGNRHHPSDFERVDSWVERLQRWFDGGLQEALVWLHQPEEHLNVEVAEHLVAKLQGAELQAAKLQSFPGNRRPQLRPLERVKVEVQGELFDA